MLSRWVTVIVFALIAAGVFALFSTGAETTADEIISTAEANEAIAESAPQQQVVASWAIRDAEVSQVRQNGIRNGLLGVCAAMLTSIAVSLALRERREPSGVAHPAAPSPPRPESDG
jgi:hypothetical protein